MNHIILLVFINILSAAGYSLIAPLYPALAAERKVCEFMVGIIFSCYAISNIICIPLTPKKVNKHGRKQLLYISMLIEGACTVIFGLIHNIQDKNLFIFVSIIARFFQGIGSAFSSTLVYSIAAAGCGEKNLKQTMGYMELAYSCGLAIGPVLGSCLFYLNGYTLPFYVLGALTFLCIPLIIKMQIIEEEYDEPEFIRILFNRDILLTSFAIVIDMISGSFIYPVFTNHLNINFGISIEVCSFFYGISMTTYFITLQFLNKLSSKLGYKLTISIGMFINFIGVLFLAPIDILPQ